MVLSGLAVTRNTMDPDISSPISDQQQILPQQQSGLSGIQAGMRDKRLLILGGGFMTVLFLGIFMMSGIAQKEAPEVLVTEVPIVAEEIPTPTQTPEYKEAVQEATQATADYDTALAEIRVEFPWIRKFPISGEGKYFVYFDEEKKVFIGKLYPQSGDTVDALKSKAKQHMEQREIPTDAYPFEWRVTSPAAQ